MQALIISNNYQAIGNNSSNDETLNSVKVCKFSHDSYLKGRSKIITRQSHSSPKSQWQLQQLTTYIQDIDKTPNERNLGLWWSCCTSLNYQQHEQLQWVSQHVTSSVFKWPKASWLPNCLDFEWLPNHMCCVFRPAFGRWATQKLVELIFSSHFQPFLFI